jgi:hypothetical protein
VWARWPLQRRNERSRFRLNPRRDERLPTIGEHDTGLEVRGKVLEESEVLAGCVVETVGGHVVMITCWALSRRAACD